MNFKDFFNIFLLFSAIHGFVFCLILSFSENKRNKALIFINLLVLVISLNNFQSWAVVKGLFLNYPFLRCIEIPWHFLIAPFFYMFLINYLEVEKKHLKILKITLSIFGLLLLIKIVILSFKAQEFLTYYNTYTIIEETLSMILSFSIFGYSFYIYQLIKKDKTQSQIIDFDNLKWIRTFFQLGLLAYILWLFPLALTFFLGFKTFLPSYYPLRVFTTILIYWLGYQAIIQLKILKERRYLREKSLNNTETQKHNNLTPDLKKSENLLNIPQEVVENIIKDLEVFEQHKHYTSPNVSLNNLAKKLNTNTNYLSKVINYHKKMSFNNYINTLRIDNITELLKTNKTIRKFTIKAIALEAGYNNSDSFSKVFFKLKGVNPSQYIKDIEKYISS